MLLKNFSPLLQKVLYPEEVIYFLSIGVLNKFMEQVLGGWWGAVLNRYAFIFTSKRILLIQLKGKNKPGKLKSMLEYASLKSFKAHLLGSLSIRLNSGKKLTFVGMPRSDKKHICKTVQNITSIIPEDKKNKKGLVHLCPKCYTPLHPDNNTFRDSCPHCKVSFKAPLKAALLSLLFPGLGNLYLGHYFMGMIEVLGALMLWSVSLSTPGRAWEVIFMTVGTFILVHVSDALLTYAMAKKGIYSN